MRKIKLTPVLAILYLPSAIMKCGSLSSGNSLVKTSTLAGNCKKVSCPWQKFTLAEIDIIFLSLTLFWQSESSTENHRECIETDLLKGIILEVNTLKTWRPEKNMCFCVTIIRVNTLSFLVCSWCHLWRLEAC